MRNRPIPVVTDPLTDSCRFQLTKCLKNSNQFPLPEFIFSNLLSGKLAPCVCNLPWCTTLRGKHLFSITSVRFPTDIEESEVWLILLGSHGVIVASRVYIIVSSTGDGYCQFYSIDRMGPTKYQTADTGNRSLVAPARPACAKFVIAESIFYNVKELLNCDYVIHQTAWSKVKKSRVLKRKEIQNSSTFNVTDTSLQSTPSNNFLQFLDATSGEMRAGRVPDTPYNENQMGASLKTVALIKAIYHHAKNCIGNIVIRRSNVAQKRLSIQITVTCSEKHKCSTWERGSYPWQSTNKVGFPNSSRPAFVPNVFYAMACYMTSTTKAHAEQYFSCMLLVPPSRPMLNDLVKSFVSPRCS